MEMTPKKDEKTGLPSTQFISLMLTMVTMIVAAFFYITNMDKRIAMLEKQVSQTALSLADLDNVVTLGMGKRLELQRDSENTKDNLKQLRDENTRDHQEIKNILNKLMEEKRLASLKTDSIKTQ